MWRFGGGFPRAAFLGAGIVQYPGPYKGAGAHGCCAKGPREYKDPVNYLLRDSVYQLIVTRPENYNTFLQLL